MAPQKCWFIRSFNNAQKRAVVKKALAGICHLCQGGRDNYPIEQFMTKRPTWWDTMYQQSPFEVLPVFAEIPHVPGRLEGLWAFDLFHVWNLGVAILAMLSDTEPGSTIDQRFDMLSSRYRMWCRDNGQPAIITKISKDTITWSSRTEYPHGSWFKASLSNVLLDWVLDRADTEEFEDNQLLRLAFEAGRAMRDAMRRLFRSACWLPAAEAREIAQYGLKFLKRYSQAGTLAFQNDQALFAVMPKGHALQHIWLQLYRDSFSVDYCLNPLIFAVAPDEDFIGRNSRVSRRVSTQRVISRVTQRYLQAAYAEWLKAGLIARKR